MAADLPAVRPGAETQDSLYLNIDLTLPVTRVGMSIISFDLVEQLIRAPVSHFLKPLLRAPRFRRPSQAGPAVDVYPLRIPEGEGLGEPLGQWGELGFANKRGLLVLTVPWQVKGWCSSDSPGTSCVVRRRG
jgi:hypothetical protein